MFRSIKFFAIAIFLVIGTQAAHAAPRSEPVTIQVKVYYGDLNLQHKAGAETILKRLDAAAITACGGRVVAGPSYTESRVRFARCRTEAIRAAVTELNVPVVSAAYLERKNAKPIANLASR